MDVAMTLGKRKAAQIIQRAVRRKILNRTTKYSKGAYSRRKGPAVGWRSRKMIKAMIRNNAESKRCDYSWGRTALYHNGGADNLSGAILYNLTANNISGLWPTQGDTEESRDGNDIYVKGITLRMQFNVPSDRLNSKFRVAVIRSPKGTNPVATVTGMFDNITGNMMIDPWDKDRVQVVKQIFVSPGKSMNPGVPTTGKEVTHYRKVYVPFNKIVRFFDNTVTTNSLLHDYHLCIWGYDTWGTTPIDIVGYCQIWQRLTFKDK